MTKEQKYLIAFGGCTMDILHHYYNNGDSNKLSLLLPIFTMYKAFNYLSNAEFDTNLATVAISQLSDEDEKELLLEQIFELISNVAEPNVGCSTLEEIKAYYIFGMFTILTIKNGESEEVDINSMSVFAQSYHVFCIIQQNNYSIENSFKHEMINTLNFKEILENIQTLYQQVF